MCNENLILSSSALATGRVRLRKFTAVDRESPIFEVLLDSTVIFDVARCDGSDLSGQFEIAIHEGAVGLQISIDALSEIVRTAKELIAEDEAES